MDFKRTIYVSTFIIFWSNLIVSSAHSSQTLSLQQALDLALHNNASVLLARAEIGAAQGRNGEARSDLLPQIDIGASQTRVWWENYGAQGFAAAGVVGPYNTFDARVEVSQRLFDLSALSRAEAGKIQLQAAYIKEDLVNQQVISAVSLMYVEALRQQEQLRVSQKDLDLSQHLLAVSQHANQAGTASDLDVARSRTQLAQEEARFEEVVLNGQKAVLELKRAIGLPLAEEIALSDRLVSLQDQWPTIDRAVDLAEENRIEVKLAKTQIDYADKNLQGAAREHLPVLTAVGNYGETGSFPDRSLKHASQAGIQLTMPIWEGNRTSSLVKEKAAVRSQDEIRLDELKKAIEEDVRLAYQTLVSSRKEMEANGRLIQLANRELTLAQDRFSTGVGDNTEVINAQTALADAHDAYVAALSQYNQGRLNLYMALGQAQDFHLGDSHE